MFLLRNAAPSAVISRNCLHKISKKLGYWKYVVWK